MCFWLGFDMAFVAKARQKMDTHCTPKSRNLELHLTMYVFLLAASLNFEIYWRALLSFPVLANTGIYIYIPQRKAPHLERDDNVLAVPCPLPFLLLLPLPPPSSLTLTLSPLFLFFC